MNRYTRLIILLLSLLAADCQAQSHKKAVVVDSFPKEEMADKPHNVEFVEVEPEACPKNYFRNPLDIPAVMNGTFAEIRSNHYHSGVDLGVGGKVGAPIYAAQEGFVSRINISAWGGGKILYIDHPNGYRTVYMHLNDFTGEIAKYVRDYQYGHECFAFDIDVPAGRLPVKKGQVVAHAGNTGSSGGPHLHYEIRLAKTDQTINPLYFGINYTDDVAPEIRGVRLYPEKGASIEVKEAVTEVPSRFYAGVYVVDRCGKTSGKNGPDRIELFVDDTLVFQYRATTFLFEESRNVNAIIDYPRYKSTGEYYIVTRQLPALRNPNHKANHHGWITLRDTLPHKLTYHVYDAKNNRTSKSFSVKTGMQETVAEPTGMGGIAIAYRKGGLVKGEGSTLRIPPFALYADDEVVVSESADGRFLTPVTGYMPTHNPIPPHVACTLTMAKPKNVGDPTKLVIVMVKGSRYTAVATKIEGQNLVANVKEFGQYAVMKDTEAPSIRAVNFKEGKSVATLQSLRIKVTDNLSGLEKYSCRVDGKWELAEYDGKTASLYLAAKLIPKGTHTLEVTATDAVGNVVTKTFKITK